MKVAHTVNRHPSSALHHLYTLLVISALAWLCLSVVMFVTLRTTPCLNTSVALDKRIAQWQYANQTVNQSPWLNTVARLSQPLMSFIHGLGNEHIYPASLQRQTNLRMMIKKLLPDAMVSTAQCFITLTTQQGRILWQKWIRVMAMLPWCVLAIGIGVCEGMVQRYIRRCELGRESSYRFHTISKWLWQIALLIWWGYWLVASDTTACWYGVGFIGLVGLIQYQRCAQFKKYV